MAYQRKPSKKRPKAMATSAQQGFTLLELIIAIVVFAVMSTIAFSGLTAINNSRYASETHMERLAAVQKTMLILQSDLEQMRARPIRDAFGDSQAALQVHGQFEEIRFELTRGGSIIPGPGRSPLLRVGYGLSDDKLYRYQWTVLDRAQDSLPIKTLILRDVEELNLKFLSAKGESGDIWPPEEQGIAANNSLALLPAGVEVELQLSDWGNIRRVFHGVF